jgi:ankyrin repeat protein
MATNRILVAAVAALLSVAAERAWAAGDTRLADAAMKRDTATVRTLIDQHVDLNAPGADGTPALHWLVRVDDFETARRLIRAGADVSKPNRYGVTPMSLASANGSAEMIALLLEAGADANVTDQTGETVLMTATKVGNVDAIRALLDHGATVDTRDPVFQQTALMMAVRENHPDVIKLLIDRGAQVNVQTRTGPTPNWVLPNSVPRLWPRHRHRPGRPARSRIPLSHSRGAHAAALRGARRSIESAKILLAAGAEIEHADANGITPLLMAITNDHIEMARYFIDQGANVKAVDWYGRTPLWAAVDTRNMDVDSSTFENGVDRAPVLELIKVILDKGGDLNARTKETPPMRQMLQ